MNGQNKFFMCFIFALVIPSSLLIFSFASICHCTFSSFSFISLSFLKGELTCYSWINTHLTHIQKLSRVHTERQTQIQSRWYSDTGGVCCVVRREYLLVKGLIYNCCTVETLCCYWLCFVSDLLHQRCFLALK